MLFRFLGGESRLFNDLASFFLRVGVGAAMLFGHGLGKLNAWSESSATFADPLGVSPQVSMALAIFAEVFCSLLLILGAVTRLAVIPLTTTMLVAIAFVHTADPWAKKEMAFVYLLIYVGIFFVGPGRFSVDGLLLQKKS